MPKETEADSRFPLFVVLYDAAVEEYYREYCEYGDQMSCKVLSLHYVYLLLYIKIRELPV